MIKFVIIKTAMMRHQAQTGRKAATRPRETARYDVWRRKNGVARK